MAGTIRMFRVIRLMAIAGLVLLAGIAAWCWTTRNFLALGLTGVLDGLVLTVLLITHRALGQTSDLDAYRRRHEQKGGRTPAGGPAPRGWKRRRRSSGNGA